MLESWNKVVFFGAHTDDEMICAGTLHRLARLGSDVHVVTFGPAALQSDRNGTHLSLEVVGKEWHAALDLIGVKQYARHFLGMVPSADLAARRQDICQCVYDFCVRERPDCVFTLSPEDENTAHAVVGVECERVLRGRVPCAVRCHFPWNYGIGRPNLFVTLGPEDVMAKAAVIAAYKSQAFRYQYGDMLMHYIAADGLSVKVPAAEKFELIRSVV